MISIKFEAFFEVNFARMPGRETLPVCVALISGYVCMREEGATPLIRVAKALSPEYLDEIDRYNDFFAAGFEMRNELLPRGDKPGEDQRDGHGGEETLADDGEIDPMNLGGAGREPHVSYPSFASNCILTLHFDLPQDKGKPRARAV